MARKVDIIAELVAESREFDELGQGMQGARDLLASEDQIATLVERYHNWFGRAVAVIPEEFGDRIANRRTLEADLCGERDGLIIRVVVVQ